MERYRAVHQEDVPHFICCEVLYENSKKELLERLERLKKSSLRIDQQTYAGVEVVDQIIRRYPYQSLGVAALGGMVLGIILNKR